MSRYIIRRLLWMIPTLLGIMFIIFTISYLTPGDPAMIALGNNYTEEAYQAKIIEMGLDKGFITRYFIYIKDVVTKFDLGTSYSNLRPVRDLILEKVGVTLRLGLLSSLVTIVVGVTVGIIAAVKQYSAMDYIATSLSVLFSAMPGFFMALVCIIVFSLKLKWLPAAGLSTWRHYILPVLCLGLSPIAVVNRLTRSSMLDVIRQDYIRTARAKGVDERTVITKHALRNALIPVITVIGGQLSMVIGGSVIIESIFSIPGMGTLMMTGINNRDYPIIQGTVLVLSIVICVVNLLVDLAYAAVDPRIKAQYYGGDKRKRRDDKGEGKAKKKGAA